MSTRIATRSTSQARGNHQEIIDVSSSNVYRGRGSSLASSQSSGKNTPIDKEERTHRGRHCRAHPVRKDGRLRYERARKEPSPINGRVVPYDTTTTGQLVPLAEGNHTATGGIGNKIYCLGYSRGESMVANGKAETELSGAAPKTGA